VSAPTLARLAAEIGALAERVAVPAAAPRTCMAMAEAIGLALDPWQAQAVADPARQSLWNVTRQGGKSTVAALLGLHEVLAVPGALVLAVSPTLRQSQLLFATLMRFYRQLGRPVPAVAENRLSLELANGAQVVALPGDADTIRGYAGVSLLLVDEAARVADELMAACRPFLAVSGGRLIALSTPWGKRGWWYQAWSEGGPDWTRIEVPAAACPRISPAFLAQERRALPPMWFASEYECRFVEPEDAYFDHAAIAAAFTADVPRLFPLGAADVA
jgi:hypothetical protein